MAHKVIALVALLALAAAASAARESGHVDHVQSSLSDNAIGSASRILQSSLNKGKDDKKKPNDDTGPTGEKRRSKEKSMLR